MKMTPASLRAQAPDPARFWVQDVPSAWPGPDLWTDLARCGLGATRTVALPRIERARGGLVYVPPVVEDRIAERDALVDAALAAGAPVLCQVALREPAPPEGAVVVVDLLEALLGPEPLALENVESATAAVWPLLPGLTDDPERQERELAALRAAGIRVVQPLVLNLSPADRRRLAADRDEEVYHALFHGDEPAERPFSQRAAAAGLEPFLPRPANRTNQRLAGQLLLAAELWLRLGRPLSQGLALSRAGRWADETPKDVAGLAREGNLGVVEAVDGRSRALLEASVKQGAPSLLDELTREYLESPDDRSLESEEE